MGMSVGVTFSTADNSYRIFREEEAEKLIEQLRTADLVVGYNHIGFDYGVLQAYTFWNIADVSNNLDLCTYLSDKLGLNSTPSHVPPSVGTLKQPKAPMPSSGGLLTRKRTKKTICSILPDIAVTMSRSLWRCTNSACSAVTFFSKIAGAKSRRSP